MEVAKSEVLASPRSAENRQTNRRPQFFSAKSHASIWRALRVSLLRAEGVILVTGGEGSGKSALIKRLNGMLPDNRDLAVIPSVEISDAEFLQQLITASSLTMGGEFGSLSPVENDAPEFHLPRSMPVLTAQDLIDAMEERIAMGRKLVLAVDQAHLLNEEQLVLLEMMVGFVSEGVRPVQLVLVGRPELRTLIASEVGRNLAERVVGSCEVTPLTRREVWDYLAFQLSKSTGWPVRVSWMGWVEFFRYSQGVPQKIDHLLKRILPQVRQNNSKVITRAMVRVAMKTGRPMRQGSFLGKIPLRLNPRAMYVAGGVVLLSVVGVLGSGVFRSSEQSPVVEPPVVVKKGISGEPSSYVQIFKPEPPPISPKSLASKDVKPVDEKGDAKSTQDKKRYWEPTIQNRATAPQPLPEREDSKPQLDKSNIKVPPNRLNTDSESSKNRFLPAKTLSVVRSVENDGPEKADDEEVLPPSDFVKHPPPPPPKAGRVPVGEMPAKAPPVKPEPVKADSTARGGANTGVSGVATEKSFRAAGKLYVVQIGSYSVLEKAEQLKKNLEASGGNPYVHLFEKNHRRWFSVRMNYRVREAADRMAKTIQKQEGIPTKVLALNYD
ncbi:MAG: AAA family ATPase [Magnetococcales bacterium]|nr:AAA family ATPase [Magnetococcales bacterium]